MSSLPGDPTSTAMEYRPGHDCIHKCCHKHKTTKAHAARVVGDLHLVERARQGIDVHAALHPMSKDSMLRHVQHDLMALVNTLNEDGKEVRFAHVKNLALVWE